MTNPDTRYGLKAAYYTLGCKLNFAETSSIGRALTAMGISETGRGDTPDICVVNTCSVTENADKKGRSLIRRLARSYPQALIVVTGCYAQLKPQEVAALPGVGIVAGSNDKHRIPDLIREYLRRESDTAGNRESMLEVNTVGCNDMFRPSCARGERTRFFLKVQDGCDYFCTYCTIPHARGRSRSGTVSEIVELARNAAAEGGKEIVLTGVNVGEFGKNNGESLFDLIKALDRIEEIERFRISSIEPNLLSDDIIEWIAAESRAFMPHFHIPLQSGSDEVLRKMNRRYDTELFAGKISKIRSIIPHAFIGVDIIAGARGETQHEWEKSLEFLKSLDVSRFHVFPYSERPGTAALLLGDAVDKGERNRRAAELIALSDAKLAAFVERNVGLERKVLWEHKTKKADTMTGLTDNYLRLEAPFVADYINKITTVRIEDSIPVSPEIYKASHI